MIEIENKNSKHKHQWLNLVRSGNLGTMFYEQEYIGWQLSLLFQTHYRKFLYYGEYGP